MTSNNWRWIWIPSNVQPLYFILLRKDSGQWENAENKVSTIGAFDSSDDDLSLSQIPPRINSKGLSPEHYIPLSVFDVNPDAILRPEYLNLETVHKSDNQSLTPPDDQDIRINVPLTYFDHSAADELSHHFQSLEDSALVPPGCYGMPLRISI